MVSGILDGATAFRSEWVGLAVAVYALALFGTVLLVGAVLVRLPARHFQRPAPAGSLDGQGKPVASRVAVLARNSLGLLLIVAGLVLALPGVPGQGVLTILVGLLLVDLPGKRRLERRLVARPEVRDAINRLRARFRQPPLVLDSAEEAAAPAPQPVTWHALAAAEVASHIRTDPARGLTEGEARRRLAQVGPNTIAQAPARAGLKILLGQFRSPLVFLLLAATAIALFLGEVQEGLAVLAVLVLNAALGFLTEWRAERSLEALRRQAVARARVVRDGGERMALASELVPGDVVVLAAGDRVPADGRLTECMRLEVDEATLTGESLPVHKDPAPLGAADLPLGDRRSMAYLGTVVTEGRGRMLVTATGPATEVGAIGKLLEETAPPRSPLEQRLDDLGRTLLILVLATCTVLVAIGWLRGQPFWPMLEVGISLAIAAVPEGLPAVATITLALGMHRMARAGAIIRRLPAVETLGATAVICTDKTGTLTCNEMTVTALQLGLRRLAVSGGGYACTGHVTEGGRLLAAAEDTHLDLALRAAALCNDARVTHGPAGDTVLGDPTEAALLVAAEKAGLDLAALARDYPRRAEIPFESHTRRMVTVHRAPSSTLVAFAKGSPGTILEASRSQRGPGGVAPLTEADRAEILGQNRALAGEALRVLGLAYRELPEAYRQEDLDRDWVFLGLAGMRDPLRPEVREAIQTCRAAGTRVVMLTGDQPLTAAAVAHELGLDTDAAGQPLPVVHARELDGLDAAGWRSVAAQAAVFARVSPKHKLQIVEALQREGAVVAMTGDGVNDAPALKQADLGVAMGVKGTEVAREAADMVLTDDNFATIVRAVEQGRIVDANILKFIHYLFSCNLAEILVVAVAVLLGGPLPLTALQVLWLNLVTDVLPALALAVEPAAPGMMQRRPRDPREPLLGWGLLLLIGWQGLLLTGATLAAFTAVRTWHSGGDEGLVYGVTAAFTTLAFSQTVHAFNTRSRRRSIFTRHLFTNGWLWLAVLTCIVLQAVAVYWGPLRQLLKTVPPTGADWAVIGACSLAPVAVVEIAKVVFRRDHANRRSNEAARPNSAK